MGLIDFAKHAGRTILRRDDEDDAHGQAPAAPAAADPAAAPQADASSAPVSEPPVEAGSVAAATPPNPAPAAAASTPTSALGTTTGSGRDRTYTTKAGDTLEALAAFFYGDPVHRQRLLDENPGLAASSTELREGTSLRVPEDPAPVGSTATGATGASDAGASFDTAAAAAAAAARLTELGGTLGIPVQDLSIQVSGERATVTGTAPTQADREKLVLLVGNTAGIAQVDDQLTVVTPAPEAVFYEVRPGDTLSAIAQAHYGDAAQYPAIFEANRPMLDDPDRIYPGQMLRIPPR